MASPAPVGPPSGGRRILVENIIAQNLWVRFKVWAELLANAPGPVLDFGPERGPGKGTMADLGPLIRHLVSTRLPFCLLCPPCTALDHASSLSHKLAYVPGPTFGFVKLLASSGSHCTKWADEQHRQAGFESRLVPDLPLPFIPTLIGLRAFDLVSSRVWWEAATNTWYTCRKTTSTMTMDSYSFLEVHVQQCQLANITLSEPINSIVHMSTSRGSCLTSSFFNISTTIKILF